MDVKDIFSKIGIVKLVNGVLQEEYEKGIYREVPDVYIDTEVYQRSEDSRAVITAWSAEHGYEEIPLTTAQKYFKDLKGRKYSMAFSQAVWGNLCTSKPVHVESNKDQKVGELFGAEFALEFGKPGSSRSQYNSCLVESSENNDTYFVTAVSGDTKKIFERDSFLPADEKTSIIRSFDRVIPLSNFVTDILKGKTYNGCLCVEQKENKLFIWVISKVGEKYIPTAKKAVNIPEINTAESLLNTINVLLHEMVRVKHYQLPERVVLLLNGDSMRDGMFTEEDLVKIVMKATYLQDPDKVIKVNEKYPALKGLKLMEDELNKGEK